MSSDLIGFDHLTLKGDPLSRAIAALRVARLQVRLAIDDTSSWRVEAALSDIEDNLNDDLRNLIDAIDDDAADADGSSEALALRQAELPLRAA